MILEGKKALVFGVANDRSIAYGISESFKNNGARLAFNYMGDAIKNVLNQSAKSSEASLFFNAT